MVGVAVNFCVFLDVLGIDDLKSVLLIIGFLEVVLGLLSAILLIGVVYSRYIL
jgi:hypothetical protein